MGVNRRLFNSDWWLQTSLIFPLSVWWWSQFTSQLVVLTWDTILWKIEGQPLNKPWRHPTIKHRGASGVDRYATQKGVESSNISFRKTTTVMDKRPRLPVACMVSDIILRWVINPKRCSYCTCVCVWVTRPRSVGKQISAGLSNVSQSPSSCFLMFFFSG